MVDLLTLLWLFHATQPARSITTAQYPQAELSTPAHPTNSFTVKFRVDLKRFDGELRLLQIPEVLTVRLRQHHPADRQRQNYPAFRMSDGTVPVLEASLTLHSIEHPDWTNMTLGIPVAMLRRPEGKHEVVLHFSGVRWTLYVDGALLDNDFPFGYPRWPASCKWTIDPARVSRAEFFSPGIEPTSKRVRTSEAPPEIQYWLPPGHNNWVGDVATLSYGGRYHVFYLFDRRHHQSKFGCGAHYFEHLSTRDFRTWTEHEAATPLEEQWECIGTGVPFVFNQTLGVSYGLHTTRVYPEAATTLPAQWDYLKLHGRTGQFNRPNTPGYPAGSTYAVSTDGGSRFRKSHIMFHPCENPSVFTDPSGRLRLLANYRSRGTWESDSVDGGWRCVNPDFPPGGDCTFFFRWGKFDYIVGGFTGLWSKPADAPDNAYRDLVREGLDFYDGANVPSIAEATGGRYLMAAWIPIHGWGGNLILREMLQFPDGRLGSRWMPELTPRTTHSRRLADSLASHNTFSTATDSFLLTCQVRPMGAGQGRLGITFLPENGAQAACEMQLDANRRRAQFGPGALSGFGEPQKSLREGGAPHQVADYAIENLLDVDRPFTLRLVVKGSEKIGGSLVDAEVAGKRTLISYRPELTVGRIAFRTDGVELDRVDLAPLRAPSKAPRP